MLKTVLIAVLLLSGLTVVAVWQRHVIIFSLISSGEPPPLLDAVEESASSYWYDDYFLVDQLDANTYAIGEPRYAQQNFSYLILGSQRAVLFDAGPGYRDIRGVAESLTDLPITFVPSHFHFDHVGNTVTFDHVAVIDLPYIRQRAVNGALTLTWAEHLGSTEGVAEPTLDVDQWLAVNSLIELGGRQLRVLYTPGHTEDSISLLDMRSGYVFTGDFIYPGPLFAFLPNSSLGDYLESTNTIIGGSSDDVALFGAHRVAAPGLPRLSTQDVRDLKATLIKVRQGDAKASGVYPREYIVNERIQLLAEPAWLQNWSVGKHASDEAR